MTAQVKARKSFDYACKQASKCRHELYQVSCFSCSQFKNCEIQQRIETNRTKLYGTYMKPYYQSI